MFEKKSLVLIATFISFISYTIAPGTIDTKKFDVDSAPKDLVWCGTSRETVLLLTENNSLYRSDDKGFNWRLLNGILTSTGKDQLDENENEVKIRLNFPDYSILFLLT